MFPGERKKKKPWWTDLAGYKIPKKKKDDMKYLLLLLYMLTKKKKKSSLQSFSPSENSFKKFERRQFSSSGMMQRCTIKMNYGNDKSSSIKFLKRYMQQIDKDDIIDKPKLFSDEEATEELVRKTETSVSDRFYRFIISPEKNGVDLELLTKTLVKKMETQMGVRFRWFGAIHKNTDHHHVHLWIDGTDKDGKKIERIPRVMVQQEIRRAAQEIITSQIGFRTKEEINAQRARMYIANRFTKLDQKLLAKQKKLPAEKDGKWAFMVKAESDGDTLRLDHLSKLGIARKHETLFKAWYLEKGWHEKLSAANNNNVFFTARKMLSYTKPENLSLYNTTDPIKGEVTKVFDPNWEETWKGAYIVENKQLGKAWLVPVPGNRNVMDIETKFVAIENKVNKNGFKYPVIFVHEEKQKQITR